MNAISVLSDATNKGIYFYLNNDELHFRIKKGAHFSSELKAAVRKHKEEIIRHLNYIEKIKAGGLGTGIVPVDPKQKNFPLSYAQQRLWFLDCAQKGTPEYNICSGYKVRGNLDLEIVELVLREILSRHQVLRTRYLEIDGIAVQQIHKLEDDLQICQRHDLSALDVAEKVTETEDLLKKLAGIKFDLSCDLMLRANFISLGQDEGILLFVTHHIASDGWSMEVFKGEFSRLYTDFKQGRATSLPPLQLQYVDYASWQSSKTCVANLEEKVQYWKTQLENLPVTHSLPLDFQRKQPTHIGGHVVSELSASVAAKLMAMSKRFKVTLFMLLHAALALVLARNSGTQDIAIGTPVANRLLPALDPLIGFFINTLVLRVNTGQISFQVFLEHVRQVHLDAQANQDVPFETLVDQLSTVRTLSHLPLIQIMLTTNSDFGVIKGDAGLPEVEVTALPVGKVNALCDLAIDMSIDQNGVYLSWVYEKGLFKHQSIEKFDRHLRNLLQALADNAITDNLQTTDLPILSEAESEQLLRTFNPSSSAFSSNLCIHSLFEQQVKLRPDSLAISAGNECLSYLALNERANRLANYLRAELQFQPDSLIALCLDQSMDMLVSILAVLKAGGAYIPLDPNYPKERLEYILAEAKPKSVITKLSQLEHGKLQWEHLVYLDQDKVEADLAYCSVDNPQVKGLRPDNLAYVIYTSGSTGKPKGVMLEHRGLVNMAQSFTKEPLCVTSKSRIMQFATFSFDASVYEWSMALCHGAQLHMVNNAQKLDMAELGRFMKNRKITHACIPPALLGHVPLHAEYSFKGVVIAGECCCPTVARQWAAHYRLVNSYGPSEITVCNAFTILDLDITNNIGSPMQNTQAFCLDEQGLPLPIGTIGELHIGGVGVARGYLNRPALTAKQFVPNPFYDSSDPSHSLRLYKSGDLVRWLADGSMEYIKRKDFQIKIRGQRIELGEVETALRSLQGVEEVVVTVLSSEEGNTLLAYYRTSQALSEGQLKEHLSDLLPSYMLPSHFIELQSFPLTQSKKIDRKALPMPEFGSHKTDLIPASTPTEKRMLELWAKLLGIDSANICTTASFFSLGGHSILSIKLIAELNSKFQSNLNIDELFRHPSVKQLANIIDGKHKSQGESLIQLLKTAAEPCADLYLIPGAADTPNAFSAVLSEMTGRQTNIFGVHHRGLLNDQAPFNSIEENAQALVEEIYSKANATQCVLVGHSFGGALALETAIQLYTLTGKKVDVITLDTYFGPSQISQTYLSKNKARIVKSIPSHLRDNFERSYQRVAELFSKQIELIAKYKPSLKEGISLKMLYAEGSTSDCMNNLIHFEKCEQENIKMFSVTGDHFSILQGKGAGHIAKLISEMCVNK